MTPSQEAMRPGVTGVQIIVNKVYGPKGDDLVGLSDVAFDGHPALTVGVRTPDGREGLVHLSPIHGDARKAGMTDIEKGTRLELFCPVSGAPLEKVDDIGDGFGASYYALYRTPALSKGAMILISNVWGHYHSRVIDEFEVIAHYADVERGG
ncbi:MAG: hypothetical protein H6705_08575 [Myxococcales bacterium]|nr:hypothetical protein [Myxococcales bacterium]